MRASSIATIPLSACAKVAVVGASAHAPAAAAYLAAAGHDVRLEGDASQPAFHLQMRNHAPDGLPLQSDVQLACVSRDAHKVVAGAEIVLLAGPATAYADVIDRIGAHLNSTQTLFLLDAPVCAVLEVSTILSNLRKDLCLCVVETGPLFDVVEYNQARIKIDGLRSGVPICGRTVNATRQGLSVGELLWTGLVPASNSLERVFCNLAGIMSAATILLLLLSDDATAPGAHAASGTTGLSAGSRAVLERLQIEFTALGRLYGVSASQVEKKLSGLRELGSVDMVRPAGEREQLLLRLAQSIKDNYVPFSEFARVAHLHVPVLDSIIELAACVIGNPLRKQGRQLADMGFVGMDFSEIVEQINA